MFDFLSSLDPSVVIVIILVVAGIMFLLSRLLSRRNSELKVYNEMLTKKMSAYSALAKSCRVAKDTDQLSAYKDVNEKALEVLELVDDLAKDSLMDLVVLTDKKSGRPGKKEFFDAADKCMKTLNEELYRKPPKFR